MSGAGLLPKSAHPENTIVYGDAGRILTEDFFIEALNGDGVRSQASSIYSALTRAEALFAATGEPVRIVHTVELEVARVGAP
jgi:hypothetical protein